MKRMLSAALSAALLLSACAFAEEAFDAEGFAAQTLGTQETLKSQKLKTKYTTWDELEVPNKIGTIWKNADGYVYQVRVNYGAEYYENPWLDVYTAIDNSGVIRSVRIGESNEHTASFLGMVTEEYLDAAYAGQTVSSSILVDTVTGATFSSGAVMYGVQAASRYAEAVYRMGGEDTEDIQIKKLKAVIPGEYEKQEVSKTFTSAMGEVKYAATGKTEDGRAFTALVVRSLFVPADEENDMSMPTYQIWIDDSTKQVFAANMLTGQFYEGFEMPDDKLHAYYDVAITSGDVFSGLTTVLVEDNPEIILSSATRVYQDAETGATPGGNDTSLSVRCCFIAAAEYYTQKH